MAMACAANVRVAAAVIIALTTAGCHGSPTQGLARPVQTSKTQTAMAEPRAPRLDGPYKVVAGEPGTPAVTWVFTSCGDGCAQVEMEGDSRRATARYVDLRWTIDLHSTGALKCGDGKLVPGTAHYSWNPDTLEGRYWSTADGGSPCGYEQSLDTFPVPLTLTWAGPPRAGT